MASLPDTTVVSAVFSTSYIYRTGILQIEKLKKLKSSDVWLDSDPDLKLWIIPEQQKKSKCRMDF